jgi:beta-aspartyl-peptidase (threonine type)
MNTSMNSMARLRILPALAVVGLVVLLVLRLRGGEAPEEKVRAAVRNVLDKQVEAWNRGDLDGFMAGYWRSDDLTFFSGSKEGTQVRHGWHETFDRYRQRYKAEGKEMGRLKFDDLQIDPTGPRSAVVRGRWGLTFTDGRTAGGLFTLLFREEAQGWCIVHDHTSG